MRTALLAIPLLLLPHAASGQELERPADWKVRFDRAGSDDAALRFVTMEPGWHITTGPAGILYHPSRTAEGEYRVESEIFLFPGRPREAFGVFIGGRNLANENQSYVYFLIRGDGRFLIKRRQGASTETISPWTEHAAIVKMGSGEDPVKNMFAIHVGGEQVDFYMNGQKLQSLPRTELQLDGIVGLRVNHSLNLHVTNLTVEK